ncbi:MAG: pyruvate kinase alpha/beta domain-containing protein [bacterium]|nr:pyruvate kinase alpha/beta domain-containing protein [bacterium]
MYFDGKGPIYTNETLEIAINTAMAREIKHIVVASTTGETGASLSKLAKGKNIKVIVVTHNTGFKTENIQELDNKMKKEIEENGGIILTCPMVLRSLGAAIKNTTGFSHQQIVADTLRMFCQGMKVCVEIVAMAADSGFIPFEKVIAVGGTAKGADTAVIIKANSSNKFFDIKVCEILVKPSKF